MKRSGNGMSIFTRELLSYFNSPIAYIFIVVFVMMLNGMFMSQFFLIGNADMRYFFDLLPLILCVFIPAITMRLWAEERKGNTFELLLTFPMCTYALVLGKYLAGFVFYFLALAATLCVPVMLTIVGKPDMGPIIGGYVGALFAGAFFLSVGIFVSGLCKDQIVSFIVAMIACFFFYLSGLDFMASLVDGWLPGAGSFLKENFGMTRHFSGFARGVVDNRDILYFVVMTVVFLALNMFCIEDRLRPKAKVLFSAAVGICIVLSMVLNSLFMDIPLGRYDLTENKLYTVSDATKNILSGLKAPVSIKLYISPHESMPTALKTLEQEIVDRLDELKVFSGGNLSYKVFHMEPVQQQVGPEGKKEDSLEDVLQKKGISPFQVRSIEQDEVGIKLIYSAMAIAYKEKAEAVIPRLVPQNLSNFEYELMSRVYRMTLDKTPKVALAAPYTEKQADAQILQMLKQMGQALPEQYREDKFRYLEAIMDYEDYEVKRIRLTKDEPIPDGTNTLIVAAPEALSERQRYEINRFLAGGGNVIIIGQGYIYNYQPTGMQGLSITPQKIEHGLNELLNNYGLSISDKMLMDEQNDTISISGSMNFGPFEVSIPVKVPVQILVTEEQMNSDVSITSRLSRFLYLWGSALEVDENKIRQLKLKKTGLFESSERSWLAEYKGGSLAPVDLQKSALGYAGPQTLGVLVEGQFPDVFQGKPVPEWPKEEVDESVDASAQETVENKTLELKPGKLLVMGCSKMFEEDIIRNGGMANLFINAVDALTLGGELIKIRGQQAVSRSIKALDKVKKLWYRFMTTVLVPLAVIILGSFRAVMRRKEKEQYLKLLSFGKL